MDNAEEWLGAAARIVGLVTDAIAVLVIGAGSIEALYRGLRAAWAASTASEQRAIWLRFSHWLVAGLSFQLASDMVGTAVAPNWDAIGRLAAIAAIRGSLSLLLQLEARNAGGAAPEALAEHPEETTR